MIIKEKHLSFVKKYEYGDVHVMMAAMPIYNKYL